MKTFLKAAGIVLLIAFVVMQFIRPDRTNPESDPARSIWSDPTLPQNVAVHLKTSCIDCHSNLTVWPWYSNIAPISWLVANDVDGGRRRMNFSKWLDYPEEKRSKMKKEIGEEVASGEMPLGIYTLVHTNAKLTPEEVKEIVAWSGGGSSTGEGASSETNESE